MANYVFLYEDIILSYMSLLRVKRNNNRKTMLQKQDLQDY